jgi:hypothetical protein
MSWTRAQARHFARSVIKAHPGVWDWINDETRHAFIDAECLAIVASQQAETISTGAINDLRREMHRAAAQERRTEE